MHNNHNHHPSSGNDDYTPSNDYYDSSYDHATRDDHNHEPSRDHDDQGSDYDYYDMPVGRPGLRYIQLWHTSWMGLFLRQWPFEQQMPRFVLIEDSTAVTKRK